jgi:predicted RNA-binding protein with PIN domain
MVQEKIMQPDWLIIDGYNLLHQVDELQPLIRTDLLVARHRLVRWVENTAHRLAPQTTIVFDGRETGIDETLTSTHLEVFFSPGNLSADTVIERLVAKYARPEKILVVTSDLAEHATVSSAGADVMSSQEFLAQCQRDARRHNGRRTPPGQEPRLGDVFPDGL